MKRSRMFLFLTGLGLAAAALVALRATAGDQVKPRLDRSKGEVVEKPATALVAEKSAVVATRAGAGENPSVRPGNVTWHADFARARAASAKSGKPVLLFQMLGRLDQQFC